MPNLANYKAIIKGNMIQNCPVTVDDIILAEKIYGKSIALLKGKSTRSTPKAIVDDYINIPEELTDNNPTVNLYIDTLTICGCHFLLTIDKNVRYWSLYTLNNKSKQWYEKHLRQLVKKYKVAGYSVKWIHCDNEYKGMFDELAQQFNIQVNYTNAGAGY